MINGSVGKKIIFFGYENSSSVHIDGWNKIIFVLGEGPIQGLDNSTEAKYPINFTESRKRFVFNLHHNGANSFFIC